MPQIAFITHPEVQFDWTIPVPEWDLSQTGRARLEHLAARPWTQALTHIFASTERKAITTAQPLAPSRQPARPIPPRPPRNRPLRRRNARPGGI